MREMVSVERVLDLLNLIRENWKPLIATFVLAVISILWLFFQPILAPLILLLGTVNITNWLMILLTFGLFYTNRQLRGITERQTNLTENEYTPRLRAEIRGKPVENLADTRRLQVRVSNNGDGDAYKLRLQLKPYFNSEYFQGEETIRPLKKTQEEDGWIRNEGVDIKAGETDKLFEAGGMINYQRDGGEGSVLLTHLSDEFEGKGIDRTRVQISLVYNTFLEKDQLIQLADHVVKFKRRTGYSMAEAFEEGMAYDRYQSIADSGLDPLEIDITGINPSEIKAVDPGEAIEEEEKK